MQIAWCDNSEIKPRKGQQQHMRMVQIDCSEMIKSKSNVRHSDFMAIYVNHLINVCVNFAANFGLRLF